MAKQGNQRVENLHSSRAGAWLEHHGYSVVASLGRLLRKPWAMPNFIKPPKASRLPDIVTVEEAQALFAATHTLSYRVFYFTLYSLGLRLSEGLALTVADTEDGWILMTAAR